MLPVHTRRIGRFCLSLAFIFTLLLAGCGSSSSGEPASEAAGDNVVVSTVEARPTAIQGGKPEASPAPAATNRPSSGTSQAVRPTTGRWIDVDVTRFTVQLMEGTNVVRTIEPVAVGEQVDTGAYLSTQTGLFHVYVKTEPLAYDAPYDTYISHWVGFDPAKDNGFHSFLKDETGKVVDGSTGRISNGCIRTGEAEAIFALAEIGMPVYVHT
ncbi:MAG TPA: L,D-transpeptidase [Dehalococcoidia bacterium]|nr:L,D-transpeptidase [Dehalococcoidia bacterium]